MSNVIRLSSEALRGVNKKGVLKPDENGWYTVILGALEYPNSYGATYDAHPAKQLLEADSVFTRRLKKGMLYGELGHPRRLPGMTDQMYMSRLMDIYEPNVSHAIKDLIINPNAKDVNGNSFIAFQGKVKPYGPHKQMLIDGFEDPDIMVAFSIRSFTQDRFVGGRLHKSLRQIVTFDKVHEPGIDKATKANAPALEMSCESYADMVVTREMFESVVKEQTKHGMESSSIILQANEMIGQFDALRSHEINALTSGKPDWVRKW